MNSLILYLLIQPVITATAVILSNSFLPFLKKKSENLATKQDIGKITEQVESVKRTFTDQNEKLKAKLSVIGAIQTGIASEERNAIVDYTVTFHQWFSKLTETTFGGIDRTKNEQLEIHLKSISDKYNSLLICEAKLELFIENKEIIKRANEIKLKIGATLNEAMYNFVLYFMSYNNQVSKKYQSQSYSKELESLKNELFDRERNVIDYIWKEITEIKPEITHFHKICREHIYKLMNEYEAKMSD
jgi:hypothetical protein